MCISIAFIIDRQDRVAATKVIAGIPREMPPLCNIGDGRKRKAPAICRTANIAEFICTHIIGGLVVLCQLRPRASARSHPGRGGRNIRAGMQ
jgi:hypothetical protein